MYVYNNHLFLFSIPPTAEVARAWTRYQPSLVTGHVCCSITCHAIAVLTAASRHVQPAALCSAVMQWAAAALQHLQSCVMDRDYLLYWQLPVSLAPRSWSHVTAAAILIQCSCAVRWISEQREWWGEGEETSCLHMTKAGIPSVSREDR